MRDRRGYDEKLDRILKAATAAFAEKGYHQASIRDISAATEVSLSGLYYYFRSKEDLLFLIQEHCFRTLVQEARRIAAYDHPPRVRLGCLVRAHLDFFLNNTKEMKVLSHESDVLTGEYARKVSALKREYVGIVSGTLEELSPGSGGADVRVATMALFGMMNWIYTWYRPDRDPGVEELSEQILHIFLSGFLAEPVSRSGLGAGDGETPRIETSSIWRRP